MPRLLTLVAAVLLGITLTAQQNPGDTLSGFKLVEKRFVKELDAECLLFKHEHSGARLLKIANDDKNKTFCISFKTVTESDAGIPHILEHSVLNGSRNFPVKSPFDILAKGSLNTFINAITSDDKTVYPVSSMNDKDFRTLMHVYLDAVFNPLIYETPRILEQEGWHHDLEHIDSSITYKGVVYNEMKGSFSNPDREWYYLVNKQLFPDSPYRFDHGGYPSAIPTLSYEDFINYHRTYYHPSNSYILLYGDSDLKSDLAFIDQNYLSNYTASDKAIEIPLQPPPPSPQTASGVYAATEGAELEGNSYLSLSFVIGLRSDQQLNMGLEVLTQALFNNESAPVRLALQEAGIGQDVSAAVDNLKQNVFHIQVQNANPDDGDKFKQVVFETLEKIAEEGLDKASIAGILNRLEFGRREGLHPHMGIYYNYYALTSWFWTNEPFSGLEYEKPLAALKQAITEGYLEDLITQGILQNPHALLFTLNPQPGLEGVNDKQTKAELAAYKESLSPAELSELAEHTAQLVEYQRSEDSPEALATIPLLDLKDVETQADWFVADESRVSFFSPVRYLYDDTFTNGISFINLYFDLRVLGEDQLPYASLLANLLGSLSTDNYSFGELDKALDTHLGGFSTSLTSYLKHRDDDQLIPKFVVSTKALASKQEYAINLSGEILKHSKLDDVDRIREVLTRHHSRLSDQVKKDGQGCATRRLFSYTTHSGMFNELTEGLEYYWFISDLVENFDTNKGEIINALEGVSDLLFNKHNLIASIACAEVDLPAFKTDLHRLIKTLGKDRPVFQEWALKSRSKNEGLLAASKVQYVHQGGDFTDLGYTWSGKMRVLNQILSRDWLQNQVRVIGGAYSGYAYFSPTGQYYLASYRDPNLQSTFEAFAGTPGYLSEFDADEREMTRFIIGTIARMDRPKMPSQRIDTAIARYFTELTAEQLQSERTAVLSTTSGDIRAYDQMMSDLLKHSLYCVYGNEGILKQNEALFDKLISLD